MPLFIRSLQTRSRAPIETRDLLGSRALRARTGRSDASVPQPELARARRDPSPARLGRANRISRQQKMASPRVFVQRTCVIMDTPGRLTPASGIMPS
ncbi:Hypp4944 [Branchiostoma lanceolatum]|uniref:Hypp4944 protein n=1 Tax=Branchiostoma lanceolatum TaxID=7740 RepID=A0A8K0AE74_BRALA|nr:Hypp4944 [Branchiostoma lanceolatum]